MPTLPTPYLGTIEYSEDSVIVFASGLPAFEGERQFLLVERASAAPVLFLQSLQTPELVFMTIPVDVVLADYQLSLTVEDLADLDSEAGMAPVAGADLAVLGIVTSSRDAPTTINLMAPVVINSRTRRGRQAVQSGSGLYSCQHPLEQPRCL